MPVRSMATISVMLESGRSTITVMEVRSLMLLLYEYLGSLGVIRVCDLRLAILDKGFQSNNSVYC